ncbi:DUF4150 domain-containing protein [Mesorhizobium sp. B2-2-3]|uniref:DUF4150 domain-containing protein n=1 Tax=Mesorhizobium sp. B2-2-3 TaxID=2589963 RepID=UPI001FEE1D59|nr:DUF4150 domain-containing protein [Mesorhizobium sp. B2-2-3]
MPTHIVVNGLGLTYKGTIGISIATIPDVCKTPTPGGPVPLPYPNFANQGTLKDGTTTVFAKGGKMIAVKGSQYGMTTGDEPGTVGGVKSNTFKQATDWITYSFDVKMDGKNACRHTDKKFHNNKNAADLQGNQDAALSYDQALGLLCIIYEECKAVAGAEKFETSVDPASFNDPKFAFGSDSPGRAMKQKCVERALRKDYRNTNLIPEQSYDALGNPVPGRPPGSRRPDVVRLRGPGGPVTGNIDVFEMKFPPDVMGPGQEQAYMDIQGGGPITIIPDDCP